MRNDDAERLIQAIERQRKAARAIGRGTIDESAATEYLAATWSEAIALRTLDQAAGISPRTSSRSPSS